MTENMDTQEVKKISGVKHIISADVDIDNLKGTCRGTGRIKIRLNDDEDPEQVRQRFLKKNILAQEFKQNPNKNNEFSKPVW